MIPRSPIQRHHPRLAQEKRPRRDQRPRLSSENLPRNRTKVTHQRKTASPPQVEASLLGAWEFSTTGFGVSLLLNPLSGFGVAFSSRFGILPNSAPCPLWPLFRPPKCHFESPPEACAPAVAWLCSLFESVRRAKRPRFLGCWVGLGSASATSSNAPSSAGSSRVDGGWTGVGGGRAKVLLLRGGGRNVRESSEARGGRVLSIDGIGERPDMS